MLATCKPQRSLSLFNHLNSSKKLAGLRAHSLREIAGVEIAGVFKITGTYHIYKRIIPFGSILYSISLIARTGFSPSFVESL